MCLAAKAELTRHLEEIIDDFALTGFFGIACRIYLHRHLHTSLETQVNISKPTHLTGIHSAPRFLLKVVASQANGSLSLTREDGRGSQREPLAGEVKNLLHGGAFTFLRQPPCRVVAEEELGSGATADLQIAQQHVEGIDRHHQTHITLNKPAGAELVSFNLEDIVELVHEPLLLIYLYGAGFQVALIDIVAILVVIEEVVDVVIFQILLGGLAVKFISFATDRHIDVQRYDSALEVDSRCQLEEEPWQIIEVPRESGRGHKLQAQIAS